MIRPMTQDDLEQVEHLEQILFTHSWSIEDFVSELTQNPYASYWVNEIGGVINSYIGLWLTPEHTQISTLGVAKSYQRQGLAQQLLAFGEALSIEKSIPIVSLEVRVSNVPAISLYKKNGYKAVAIRKGYYSQPDEDAYLMLKELKGVQHAHISD